MPERKGVSNIVDDISGAGTRRPSVPPPNYHLQYPRSSLTANRAPLRRSAPGPTRFLSVAIPGRRAQSYACQLFQELKCAFAPLFYASLVGKDSTLKRWARARRASLGFPKGLKALGLARALLTPKSVARDPWDGFTGLSIRLSEKQYQVPAGLARNCRFLLSSVPAARP
jgi:hypothetical protein